MSPFALAALLVLEGCTAPMGAQRTSVRQAHKQFTANAVDGRLSDTTRLVLHRYGLEESFDNDPAAALKNLHERACTDDRRELLYALAELNYDHASHLARSVKPGEPRKAADFYLAASIYAWFYLFGEGTDPFPDPFDRRFRNACDFYNLGVSLGFTSGPGTNAVVQPASGSRLLGPGPVDVRFTRPVFKWKAEEIAMFLPADEFIVRGFSVRDRLSGLGAPLIAVGKVLDEKKFPRSIPATLLLRVPGNVRDWSAGRLTASLELYSSYDVKSVEVAGRRIPLEADITAPLAVALNQDYVWKLGSRQFFSFEEKIKSDIYLTQPYEPGRVPVIFVHGTFSSPVWWAEMWNTLRADSALREHCQFWNFIYNSGNPIPFSAARLRAEIDRKVQQLDPEGTDPALREMVVIGHSQGGLLAKLTATDTGERLWLAVSDKEFDQLKLTPEELKALRRRYFFKPLPSVKRVIFISTPHRGSYLATSFVRSLVIRFVKLPEEVVRSSAKILSLQNPLGLKPGYERRVPSSLDDMSPSNPWLLALAEEPTAPGVMAHSVVAIKGGHGPPEGGDGVVKYTSAHVDYAKSEFLVHSSHSCQDKPEVIEEVRRILLEHLAATSSPTNQDNTPPRN
jgi:pimeloyl-ACP methyl ester carboxylesterase